MDGPKHFAPDARRARGPWWWPLAVLALAAVVVGAVGAAEGGFLARVGNTADRDATGSLVTAASSGSTTECDLSTSSPITASNIATCTGTMAPAGTLPTSGSSALATTLTDKGSLTATTAGLTEGVCGPVALANAAAASDPMLVRGTTVTYAQPGPTTLTGSAGLGLSGTSGYAADVAGAAGPSTSSFTEAVWFRTTTGGTLLGFANTPSAYSPGSWDKMLWVDPAGHVVFGVYPGKVVELTTPGTYADGDWHLAVAELNTASGMSLSVDNSTPVTNTTISAQSYTGYWHVGWDNEASGWTDPPTDPYFTGTLADAAVFPAALTSTQITSLYTSTTQAGWATLVRADAASDSWPLADSGTTIYTGAVPDVSPAACSLVDATIGVTGATTTCAAPVATGACTSPSSTVTLATLSAKTTSLGVFPSPAQTVTVTVTLARDATASTTTYPYATGLHLSAPLALVTGAGGFTATLTWAAETVIL